MNWNDVQGILGSLPPTFTRNGPNYTAWKNSQTAVLSEMTTSFDAITTQTDFVSAVNGWLNAWGLLFGIPRGLEGDALFRLCLTFTLTAWRGTPVGIEKYINLARQIPSTVVENFPAVGWSLHLNPGVELTQTQINSLPGWLAFVRPAGVPYNIVGYTASGVLSTGNYFTATRFPGSWLRTAQNNIPLNIPSTTNNSICKLPTTLFTDPTINPSLS